MSVLSCFQLRGKIVQGFIARWLIFLDDQDIFVGQPANVDVTNITRTEVSIQSSQASVQHIYRTTV